MASRKAKDAKSTDNEFQYANAIPFQVWRSDGTEMPSEYSQYEKVEEGAKPIIEWQNKLGQALAAELMPGSSGLFFLQDFPVHYHLRWYQAKEDKKKHQAKHYYLFGYPEEPGVNKARKYYRSPNHFLPHLLWLIGESQDNGDCACEFCSGSKPITSKSAKAKMAPLPTVQTLQPPVTSAIPPPLTNTTPAITLQKNTVTNANAKPRTTNRPSTIPQQSNTPQQANVPHQPIAPHQPNVPHQSSVPNQHSVPQQPNITQHHIVPAQAGPPQQAAPHESQAAAPYRAPQVASTVPQGPYPVAHDHGALFRTGEVVWFKNSNSWRVGMILTSSSTLSIIPFGHPLYRTQEVIKEEADTRPFLAFSIPQINNGLQEFKGQALAQIDWSALQERFGAHADASRREGLAIEATKLAALRVDQCFSTFNPIHEPAQNYDVFGGVFLGAEKICIGEAVRILLPREQQDQVAEKGMPIVMVVKRIITSKDGGTLMFEGSLWKLQHSQLAQQPQPVNQALLPASLLGEKEFRDGVLRNRGWRVEWVLMNQGMTVNESSIRGRFYETQRLTPILNRAKFQEMLHQQHIEDIQTLLNNRGDSSGPRVGRVLNRAQAVAGAVPVAFSLGADVIEAMQL